MSPITPGSNADVTGGEAEKENPWGILILRRLLHIVKRSQFNNLSTSPKSEILISTSGNGTFVFPVILCTCGGSLQTLF